MDPLNLGEIFAANVRLYAQQNGQHLNHVADFAGVSQSQFYAVLRGETSPTLDWIAKVSVALNVEPHELLKSPPAE